MSIEQQNAFALSCMEYSSHCEGPKMEEYLKEGKFVVGFHLDFHCTFTDAFICQEVRIISVHDTYEEAVEALGGDDGFSFIREPYQKDIEAPTMFDENAPF